MKRTNLCLFDVNEPLNAELLLKRRVTFIYLVSDDLIRFVMNKKGEEGFPESSFPLVPFSRPDHVDRKFYT